jgi:hypothetical protein
MKKIQKSIKKVLIITYDWPPRNSIATHRPYSWAKYWSIQGFQITVLTSKKKFFDSPLDLDLPELSNVRVIEVAYNAFIPLNKSTENHAASLIKILKKIKNTASKLLGWDYDVRKKWANAAIKEIDRVGLDFDLVISTYGPESSHEIASKFKKKNSEIFWVADYRDLWSLNTRIDFSRISRFLTKRKELKLVGLANMFTTVSEELAETQSEIVGKRPEVIFNGFDITLDQGAYHQPFLIKNNCLNIVYTGRIYSGKRNPSVLLRAIEQLISSGKIEKSEICVNFYGLNTEVINDYIGVVRYPEVIKHHGHVTRLDALQLQRSADFLLLLESGDEDSKGFLTGKIFEYIGAGRPIISLGSQSDSAIARVLNETHCGICFVDAEEVIAEQLLACLRGTPPAWFKPDFEAIERYSRKYQAELLMNKIIQNKLNEV